eukprot:71716_1
MSSWCCSHCGLLNDTQIDKCIACFTHDHNKYWPCDKCDLLNFAASTKCIACFNKHIIPPSIEINDKWIRRYSYLKTDPDANSTSKLVEWNNKLYHIFITMNIQNNFIISMLPITSNNDVDSQREPVQPNTCMRCGIKGHDFCDRPLAGVKKRWGPGWGPILICINKQNGELYVIVNITTSNSIEDYLIIYDLNMQKLKQQLSLKADFIIDDPISKPRTFIQDMCCMHNNDSYECSLSITNDIINYWMKIISSITLPREIYDTIHLFYTFLARRNAIQLVLLTEYKEPSGPPYDHNRIYTRTIHHGLIDLHDLNSNNDGDENEINLYITNKKVIEHIDDCKHEQQRENPLLSLRINNNIYLIFNKWEGTWKISVNDGCFERKEFMNPYPYETDGGFHGEFDRIMLNECDAMNETERYLYILTQDDYNKPNFDLIAFDRQNQVFMILKKNITRSLYQQNNERMRDLVGMNVFNDCLYLQHSSDWKYIVIDGLEFKKK